MSVAITNNSGATVTLNSLVVNWIDEPENQRITAVSLVGPIWAGINNNSPSTFGVAPYEFDDPLVNRQITDGSTATLVLNFEQAPLADGQYDLTATFDGCTVSQSGTLP